jgi:hypothetical protein
VSLTTMEAFGKKVLNSCESGTLNRRRSQHWGPGIFARPHHQQHKLQTLSQRPPHRHDYYRRYADQYKCECRYYKNYPVVECHKKHRLVKSIPLSRLASRSKPPASIRQTPTVVLSTIISRHFHLACIFRAPYDILPLLVRLYPQALLHQDTEGWTPHVNLLTAQTQRRRLDSL